MPSPHLYIPQEIKIACLQAIERYFDYKRLRVQALSGLIAQGNITAGAILEIKKALRKSRSLSATRKEDVENLLDIIYQIDTTTGSLYAQILRYLCTLKTGWWIFQTGQSELKKQFFIVMCQYSAYEWDKKMIDDLTASNVEDPVATHESAHYQLQRERAYIGANLSVYQEQSQLAQLPMSSVAMSNSFVAEGRELQALLRDIGTECPVSTETSYTQVSRVLSCNA